MRLREEVQPIRFSLVLPIVQVALWNYWMDPLLRGRWWSPQVILEEKLYGKFIEPWQDDNGNIVLTRGEVIELKPPEKLAFTWADPGWTAATLVTINIRPMKAKSSLELAHSGWEHQRPLVQTELRKTHQEGWQVLLERLKQTVGVI